MARAAAADPAFSTPSDGLERQRDLTVAAFAQIGVRCIPPDGGCYTIGDIRPATREDSEAFAFRLIEEAGVTVAPGGYFHHDARLGAGFVRISFNRRIDTLLDVERRLAGLRPARDVEQRV
ncbi:aminotransferase class I/II-fold pyridoxal phosphate-dependent enzyme [Actinomadura sp. J1-007]|uniref:aminotransferase class I/II-fold pyridoxal phosphate-dependent enzyme n=1 Tax=Actinomadura sp. J1-007 TaxID=2661913 RepID=UPI001371E53D|nr:aminotransferase class I/II-fold pyridoxal phosphate-dependent enzyme [Actinomadura sp. J1-007]